MTAPPLERILYVEDDPSVASVAKLALETIGGFTVKLCASGSDAIEAAPAFGPDLVLLDVMMPGMDGPAVLEKLRKTRAAKNGGRNRVIVARPA